MMTPPATTTVKTAPQADPPLAPVTQTAEPDIPHSTSEASNLKKKIIIAVASGVVVVVIAVLVWKALKPSGPGPGFVSGNGRIEATEIDVASKLGGRVQNILVKEGEFVHTGQPLAQMQIDVLNPQRDEARAQSRQAVTAVATGEAQVAARKSDKAAAQAVVVQRKSELDALQRKLVRTRKLAKEGIVAIQDLDDDRAKALSAAAAVTAAKAQVEAAQAAVEAALSQVNGFGSGVAAAEASVARIEADILDSQLKSPRDGRVQYLVAQPGEVLAAGGKVLNLVDLGDVYLTFFLPETAVGKVALGSEVRVILDSAPGNVIPGQVSYVASTAQFTPKTVETASERQKLMFRVKAQFSRDLLQKHLKMIKTGLPGVAWLKLDPLATWPKNLEIKVPE